MPILKIYKDGRESVMGSCYMGQAPETEVSASDDEVNAARVTSMNKFFANASKINDMADRADAAVAENEKIKTAQNAVAQLKILQLVDRAGKEVRSQMAAIIATRAKKGL